MISSILPEIVFTNVLQKRIIRIDGWFIRAIIIGPSGADLYQIS